MRQFVFNLASHCFSMLLAFMTLTNAAHAAYEIQVQYLPLPSGAISAVVNDVNDFGVAVGYARYSDNSQNAVRWEKDGSPTILWNRGFASSINNSGQVIGSRNLEGLFHFRARAINADGSTIWTDLLPNSPYYQTHGLKINENGIAVGYQMDGTHPQGGLLWHYGSTMYLNRLSRTRDMNDNGVILGESGNSIHTLHPNGDLITIAYQPPYISDYHATRINNNNYIIGSGKDGPCFWDASGQIHLLPRQTGDTYGWTTCINDNNDISGVYYNSDLKKYRTYLWLNGEVPIMILGDSIEEVEVLSITNSRLMAGRHGNNPALFIVVPEPTSLVCLVVLLSPLLKRMASASN